MRALVVSVALSLTAVVSAGAQVYLLPESVPLVTAENEDWFRRGEPITFSGSFYYPVGPDRFFDGRVMARVGSYRGIPLYADSTLEPFSHVLVPTRDNLVQPYERRRVEEIAGTTGSRLPGFPVATSGEIDRRVAPVVPAEPEVPRPVVLQMIDRDTPVSAPTSGPEQPVSKPGRVKPRPGPKGIWIEYSGGRWTPAGPALEYRQDRFVRAGDYRGFPVYVRAEGDADLIFLPTSPGMIAPYRRAAPEAGPGAP
jgi:hypothetical protein